MTKFKQFTPTEEDKAYAKKAEAREKKKELKKKLKPGK